MYVIVENNQYVALGPMPWRPTMFKNTIEEDFDVIFDVPLSNDNNEVVIVNENIKILPVIDKGSTEAFNPKLKFANGPYYNFFDDRAEMYWVPQDKPLDLIKHELKEIIAANRYKYEVGGIVFTIQDKEINLITTREDRNMYLQAFQLGKDGINWKFDSSTFLTLSNVELNQIVQAVTDHVQTVFDWEASKIETIDNATTPEELDAINVTSEFWEPTRPDMIGMSIPG